MTVDRNTKIGELLEADRTLAPIFLNMGMHCLGCPASRNETIEEACMVHGVDPDEILEQIKSILQTTICRKFKRRGAAPRDKRLRMVANLAPQQKTY